MVGSVDGIADIPSDDLLAHLKADDEAGVSREVKKDIFRGFVRLGVAITAGVDPALAGVAPQLVEYVLFKARPLSDLMATISPQLGDWSGYVIRKLAEKVVDKGLDPVSDTAVDAARAVLTRDDTT